MLVRSVIFSTASAAVGLHTPAEQLMFCVGSVEITRSARAAVARRTVVASVAPEIAVLCARLFVMIFPRSARGAYHGRGRSLSLFCCNSGDDVLYTFQKDFGQCEREVKCVPRGGRGASIPKNNFT